MATPVWLIGADSEDGGQGLRLIADSGSHRLQWLISGVRVKLATPAAFFRWFAQGVAVEGEAVRGVHEAVEDGISDCRIDDHLVPVICIAYATVDALERRGLVKLSLPLNHIGRLSGR